MRFWFTLLLLPTMACAANGYKAEKITDHGVQVVRLTDAAHGASVSIAPSVGNRAFAFTVHGQNLLYFPLTSIAAPQARRLNGIPFLAPWANRMAEGGFWANGKKYQFNPNLGTLRLDRNDIAIHGMVIGSPLWKVVDVGADKHSAHVTSQLQFWKYPNLMANWPFAQTYEMTYTLANGVLEVTTKVKNLSTKPMPVVIGFHPFFHIPGVPRSEASIHIPAREHVETNRLLVPTGVMKPVNLPQWISLKDRTYDDGYTDLVRGSNDRAVFEEKAGSKEIQVLFGSRYPVGVVWAPPGRQFVCFEPMAAVTNGANLAHYGKYNELQKLAPGATWEGSFWVRASGF
ncbi:MAG TPA: aldose 1-epimerase [Bryobacteraceae bacterium]